MTASVIKNLSVDQGSDFTDTVVAKDAAGATIDLTGWSVQAQIRDIHGAATAIDLNPVITTPASGLVTLTLDKAITAAMVVVRDWKTPPSISTDCWRVWDLIGINGGVTTRLVQGSVYVSPRVTQETA